VNTYIVIVQNTQIYRYSARSIKELEEQLDKDFVGEDQVIFSHLDNFSDYSPKT